MMLSLLSALLLVSQPVDTAESVEQAAEATEAAAEAAAEAADTAADIADEAADVADEAAAEAAEAADEAAETTSAVKEEKICRRKFTSDNKFGGRNTSRKVCKTRAEWENDRRKR